MTLVSAPTAADVAAYLGEDLTGNDDRAALIDARLGNVATATRAYCRGKGFAAGGQVAEDVAAVIVSATAREVNVSPGVQREEMGGYSVLYQTGQGFTVRELVILNAYRRTAA